MNETIQMEIARAIGQVRSEMRVAVAREVPFPGVEVTGADLGHLEDGIHRLVFRLSGTQRREKGWQRLLKDLRRLHEDLVHFFAGHAGGSPSAPGSNGLIIIPVRRLSEMLIGNFP